jgi:RNA polymerase sigma factor (sigma-70 family)
MDTIKRKRRLLCGKDINLASLFLMLLNRRTYLRKLSDEDIISLYKEKQWTSCIDELYQRYAHMVFGVCMKYVKQIENAEDLTLSLFASLTEKLLQHQVQHFKSWLYVSARNSSLMFLRAHKKNIELKDVLYDDGDQRLDEKLEKDELIESLIMVFEELKQEQRICIQLFYLQKKSYEEVANITSYSMKEVKSHLQNGRRNLKLLLEKRKEGHEK